MTTRPPLPARILIPVANPMTAEERVERQAREFELLKPYLVERWQASTASTEARASASAATTA